MSARRRTSGASRASPSRRDRDQARPLEEVIGGQARTPTARCRRWAARATARPRSRPRPPACGGRGRSPPRSRRGQPPGVGGRDVQVFRREEVGQPDGLGLVANQDQGAELLQAVARQVGPAEPAELLVKGDGHPIDQRGSQVKRMLAPGECSAWVIRSDATYRGSAGPVGDHHDLAGPGDAVDIDLSVDVLLGQRDEEIARPDDLVHGRNRLRRRTPAPQPPGRRRRGRLRSRPARGRPRAGPRCTRRTASAARRRRSPRTPAACAGTTVISSVEG